MYDLDNIVGTKTQERELRRRNRIEEILKEEMEVDRITEQCNRCDEKSLLESALSSMRSNRRVNSVLLEEKAEIKNNNRFENFCECFANVVLESLLMEEELIKLNRESIREKAVNFIKGLKSVLNENNLLIEDLLVEKDKSDRVIMNEASAIEIEEYIMNESMLSQVANIIKEKVSKVVNDEKILAEAYTLIESGTLDGIEAYDTVFRNIQIENIKLALKEDKEATKDEIMEMAFYESIVDYTLLEALNTMKMVNFRSDIDRNSRKHRRGFVEI